jgi:hypothetical protein
MSAYSQVTDTDIVKATLGRNHYFINKALDSLQVWYHAHQNNRQVKNLDFKKVYSISDGKGSVKVYAFVLSKDDGGKNIEEIVINYRHDSKEQIEDSKKVKSYSDYHVGLYSTDFVFKRKK